MHKLLPASIALALAAPMGAMADTTSDIAALKQEIAAMRAAYEQRLRQMEERLKAAEASPAASSTQAAAPTTPPPLAAAPTPPSTTSPTASSSSFNPAMSLILSGTYSRTTQDPATYRISGFKLPDGAEAGPGTRGFSLAETELGFSANIDPWLRGSANISLHPDDSVSVEEAFIQTTSLGNGLGIKAGRFFSGIGYLNSQHAHTWDFVDNPLAYQAMLGTQYGDDGVQFTWLAPTDRYIELGLELGRGRGFPGTDSSRNGAGMSAITAHTGGDIGDSHNWRAGLSYLSAKASDQTLVDADAVSPGVFNGRSSVIVADAVWKWAPHGNATRTNFKLQGEYIRSRRDGTITYDAGGPVDSLYRVAQSGWYLQGVYQFMPRWRVGLRTERLNSGVPDFDANMSPLMPAAVHPRKNTLMLDYSPSEFSRVRLQLAQDRSRVDVTDNQLFVQYQMSLGAHGAHSY